eukprot:CAMPEP_0117022620 /NCGR_PEP_ID=MMETSP0472-20121206/16976_1 /TAXON_ID=693140 ORGANISM="Tiarina fusus, Strain LIS" /NCGR_SAMPLE_ID=MMETSP0472 /ASSEMBLY_ACC=CAM_ASM_000603 /LENGTH=111 /DNA_ID=CAMNT_0004728523 /DNA_START=35 /DNA_END=370 /DNA_ORIENTATION=+
MKNVAAYLLAVLGGNKEPTEADIKKILEAASANVDAEAIKKVVSELNGKSVYDVMDQGAEKLTAVPSGGARGGASGGAAAPAGGDAAPAAAAPAEEEEEESDEDMGFGLFD